MAGDHPFRYGIGHKSVHVVIHARFWKLRGEEHGDDGDSGDYQPGALKEFFQCSYSFVRQNIVEWILDVKHIKVFYVRKLDIVLCFVHNLDRNVENVRGGAKKLLDKKFE